MPVAELGQTSDTEEVAENTPPDQSNFNEGWSIKGQPFLVFTDQLVPQGPVFCEPCPLCPLLCRNNKLTRQPPRLNSKTYFDWNTTWVIGVIGVILPGKVERRRAPLQTARRLFTP
jgi:hypothetical protein